MTKRDFVIKISSEANLTQSKVAEVVQRFLDYLADEIVSGREVELRNFGVFELKVRKSRIGRNPKKPTQVVTIPETVVVKFRPGKELKNRVEQIKPAKIKRKKK